ncbi:MAG: hypothetical protein M3507_04500 [Actinomycetota bacterium]|nr:hypothetical protein [Actinomycetota bacterium]
MGSTMRTKRLLGAAAAATLLMTGPLTAAAIAQAGDPPAIPTGVGTGSVSSTVLGIDVGDLLVLDLLDDVGRSTIDPVDGVPTANGLFNPLKLTGALGDKTLGSASTSTTDGEVSDSISTNPAAGDIPVPIASGLLEGALTSVVDENGARSGLLASFGELDLVGGLLGMGASPDAVSFETNAAPDSAGGVRGLNIASLEMLNLGNLLAGIGTPLETLPLDQLTGMLEGLGVPSVPVVGEDGTTTDMPTDEVVSTVTGLVDTLDVLDELPVGDVLLSDDCTALPVVGGLLGPVLGDEAMDCEATTLPVVGDVIANVEDLLAPILEGSLPVLDGLNLLEAEGIQATMQASATDSVDSSVSEVVASIGSLNVAGLDPLGSLDLTQGTDVLAGLGDTISQTLNTGLGMDGLLDIDVLEITETIAPDGDYTSALSSLNTLGVSLDPGQILGGVAAAQVGSAVPTATSILGEGGLPLGLDGLPLGNEMLDLEAEDILEGVTSILTDGLDMQVGTLESAGSFTTVAALPPNIVPPSAQPVTPPADGTLPRTGADIALPAMLAVIMASTAVGIRRVLRPESTMATNKLER